MENMHTDVREQRVKEVIHLFHGCIATTTGTMFKFTLFVMISNYFDFYDSLVRQRMADKKQRQTPQFEGGNMNLILFSFDKGDLLVNLTLWCLQNNQVGQVFLKAQRAFCL